jgi:signal transduction histidine kinase
MNSDAGLGRFLWRIHPLRGMVETSVVGTAILFALSRQVGYVEPSVLSNGTLFLCGTCGMWAVLRIRLPGGSRLHKVLWEVAVAALLSLVMVAGMRGVAQLFGWEGVWPPSTMGTLANATLVLLCTGPGYLIARVGVRFWLLWDSMRRHRMLWALTHAHLAVVVVVVLLGALAMFALSPYAQNRMAGQPSAAGVGTLLTERLLHTVFPGMSIVVLMTAIALAILLPPSAIFSYLVARRTTRRLETLAGAARSLREGRYSGRVSVEGEDEVAQLQADFNAMAGELEQTVRDLKAQRDTTSRLLDSRRELVATVSHELRTPVATVRATLESALQRCPETVPEDLHHDLEVIQSEIVRLQGLIDDLFTLARADAGGLALSCRPLDVVPVAHRLVDALAPLAWNSGRVEVVADLPAALPPVDADEARLAQILSNLIRNGIQYTPPGGIVAVMAAPEPATVRIEIRDTGEGIDAQDLPYIWDRFYRGRATDPAEKGGAGLGLALVKELAEAMGGSVGVESTPGQGSCFTVRLPRA